MRWIKRFDCDNWRSINIYAKLVGYLFKVKGEFNIGPLLRYHLGFSRGKADKMDHATKNTNLKLWTEKSNDIIEN